MTKSCLNQNLIGSVPDDSVNDSNTRIPRPTALHIFDYMLTHMSDDKCIPSHSDRSTVRV